MSTLIETIETLALPEKPQVKTGAERRRRKRAMFAVHALVRGGVGTLEVFEDVATTLDISRDGLLLSTSRGGYSVGEKLHVTCPYWDTPTAINIPRNAVVIRSTLMPNFSYSLALQYLPGVCEEAPWAVPSSPFPNQVRVLTVESDPLMSRSLRELLEKDGYHVVSVSHAQDALEILRSETPEVILAEAEGTGVSGNDLCAIVKTTPRLRKIPVILLTTSALPSDYASSHLIGAVLCMMIPCKPERLQHAIHLVAPPPSLCSVYSARFNVSSFVRTS
jgi:CheY-like chemotaxis protein